MLIPADSTCNPVQTMKNAFAVREIFVHVNFKSHHTIAYTSNFEYVKTFLCKSMLKWFDDWRQSLMDSKKEERVIIKIYSKFLVDVF